ncbi:MAG TPA: ferredoxin-thioredoxin reductase catalytic domain-containing protein [Bacillota bacterium]|nr:ferredoxin-thioredoxin reductase catalytic domain-containing protein [Bacillota bacterium]
MENPKISDTAIDELVVKLEREAKEAGYQLNPDPEFTRELARGLLINENRYGYQACPCRLASGIKERDLDLICPCDYRDADLNDYGSCYCALYVSQAVADGTQKLGPIPERRRSLGTAEKIQSPHQSITVSMPVWRCKVCGYLCARENPPEICPICKAKERFERFL